MVILEEVTREGVHSTVNKGTKEERMLVTFYEVGYFAMFGSRQTCMSQTEMGRTRQKCTYRSLTEMCSSRQRCKNPDRGVQIPDRGVQCQTEVYRCLTEVYRFRGVQVPDRVYRSRQRCVGPRWKCTGPDRGVQVL